MGLSTERRGCYTLKTYGPKLYTWCPQTDIKKNNLKNPDYTKKCTATPGSQGEDWNCTYVYDLVVVNNKQKRLAYVECGYVE